MNIDVKPNEIRIADTLQRIFMDTYGHTELYLFVRDSGEQSVLFTESSLAEFIPSLTVSEFIESDTMKQISRWAHSTECYKRGKHPVWYLGERYKSNTEFLRGNDWFSMAVSLRDTYQKDSAKHIISDARKKLDNPWKFIKIVKNLPKYVSHERY